VLCRLGAQGSKGAQRFREFVDAGHRHQCTALARLELGLLLRGGVFGQFGFAKHQQEPLQAGLLRRQAQKVVKGGDFHDV